MKHTAFIRSGAVILGLVAAATLSGCSGHGERLVYEVISSGPGASISYTATDGKALKKSTSAEGSWLGSSDGGLQKPMLKVTPPAGGAARCRIIRVTSDSAKVVADHVGLIGEKVECTTK